MSKRCPGRLRHALKFARGSELARARSGFVYVIQCQDFVKFGIADDVRGRLSNMQTGCPFPLKLLASWPCKDAKNTERRLHKLFRQFHLRGEWFKVPEDLLAVVITLKDITQLPPP